MMIHRTGWLLFVADKWAAADDDEATERGASEANLKKKKEYK